MREHEVEKELEEKEDAKSERGSDMCYLFPHVNRERSQT